ncbi:MAG: hypothetical protein ACR2JZ_04185, partial [Candidatus Limnocylindrales bacterium]
MTPRSWLDPSRHGGRLSRRTVFQQGGDGVGKPVCDLHRRLQDVPEAMSASHTPRFVADAYGCHVEQRFDGMVDATVG